MKTLSLGLLLVLTLAFTACGTAEEMPAEEAGESTASAEMSLTILPADGDTELASEE